ncbi:carboxypeptidase regulatory-like domain-containing protein [Nocardioides sp. W7]|uniref:carboxypeptidase regulatory-like domain-containing protein n=1 Tax=Nocardioides sp. W7 TaxID=2931390 RepID=UPI001FD33BF8|nr:carboxypeptidase regulatory-like domain-containing protein [Nocardioides sp. W7]
MHPPSTRLPALILAGAVAVAGVLVPTTSATAADGLSETVTVNVTGGGQRLSTTGQVLVTPYLKDGEDFIPQDTVYGGAGYPLKMTLEEGEYTFHIATDSSLWASEFYGDTTDPGQAEVVTVEDDDVVLDPVDLDPRSNVLVGRVVDEEGDPVVGGTVQVFRTSGEEPEQSAQTDLDGVYRIATTGAADRQLQFLPPTDGDLAEEWYDDVAVRADSESLSLPTGSTGIRVPEVELRPVGSVSGRVTGSDGAPVDDVLVGAFAATGAPLGSVETDADGRYRIDRLKAGAVRIGFVDRISGFAAEYYEDATSLAAATPVTVTEAQVTTGIDATLAIAEPVTDGAAVTGRALDRAGAPIPGVEVTAWVRDGDGWKSIDWGRTDRFGRYALDAVEAETAEGEDTVVRVEFHRTEDPDGFDYRSIYHGQQPTVRRAAEVVVGWDQVRTGIDGVLQQYGGLRGTVTSPVPAFEAEVAVVDEDGREVWSGWAEEDGTWSAEVEPGQYRVHVEAEGWDSETGRPVVLAPRWWRAGNNFTTATPVTVEGGAFAPDVDVALTDQLTAYDVPTIGGSAIVGQVLRATPGRWNVNVGVEHSYEWLRGATVVGTGASYPLGGADVGSTLQLRVTARFWDWTGVATSAPTAAVVAAPIGPVPEVKQVSRTTVRASYDKRKRAVRLRITVAAASAPTGTVAVTEGRRTVRARVVLRNGRATLIVKRPSAGRHTYVVTYGGSGLVLPSKGSARVRVPKRR